MVWINLVLELEHWNMYFLSASIDDGKGGRSIVSCAYRASHAAVTMSEQNGAVRLLHHERGDRETVYLSIYFGESPESPMHPFRFNQKKCEELKKMHDHSWDQAPIRCSYRNDQDLVEAENITAHVTAWNRYSANMFRTRLISSPKTSPITFFESSAPLRHVIPR